MLMVLHEVIFFVTHFGYYAVVDFVVEIGDHYVTHVVMLVVLKAGVVHGTYKVVKHIHIKRKSAKTSE